MDKIMQVHNKIHIYVCMPGAHSFNQPYITIEYLNRFTCVGCMVRMSFKKL